MLNRSIIFRAFFLGISILFKLGLTVESKIVKHTFEVGYFTKAPEGVFKPNNILGINGQFPGPTIHADLGDDLEILLINSIGDQNTSLHWHGIHQRDSHFEDGTSWISQCSLVTNQSQLYKFRVDQAGTFWYHSHEKSQYTGGVWGALIVHNQPKENYEYQDEIQISLTDWHHRSVLENQEWHISLPSKGHMPYPDASLMNGHGRYPCHPYATLQNRTCDPTAQTRSVFKGSTNQTYRVRVINAGARSSFNFSIDGHKLYAIEVDGIETVRPVPADVAPIAPGQRYSFLINTNSTPGNYLIRAQVRKELLGYADWNINKYPEALMDEATAVLKLNHVNPGGKIEEEIEPFSYLDKVPPYPYPVDDLEVIYLDENALQPYDKIEAPSYFDQEFILDVVFDEDDQNICRGSFNGTPFKLPAGKPLLMTLLDGEPIPDSVFPLALKYMDVIQVVINNEFNGPHPFHLHGHHFWVLGTGIQGDGIYNATIHEELLVLHGAKRDTVFVYESSWAVIRFVADNPGVWTFHCHIDWHNLSGMGLAFIEAPEIAKENIKITDEAKRICALHNNSVGIRRKFFLMIDFLVILNVSLYLQE